MAMHYARCSAKLWKDLRQEGLARLLEALPNFGRKKWRPKTVSGALRALGGCSMLRRVPARADSLNSLGRCSARRRRARKRSQPYKLFWCDTKTDVLLDWRKHTRIQFLGCSVTSCRSRSGCTQVPACAAECEEEPLRIWVARRPMCLHVRKFVASTKLERGNAFTRV
jgi:hypothetical protein